MIGIDTNVLLRLITEDEPVQTRRALAALDARRGETIAVNPVVLAEFAWVLRSRYRRNRAEIAAALDLVADIEGIELTQPVAVGEAIAAFRADAGRIGFADHLIAALNRAAGATHTLTFDEAAASQPGFALVAGAA